MTEFQESHWHPMKRPSQAELDKKKNQLLTPPEPEKQLSDNTELTTLPKKNSYDTAPSHEKPPVDTETTPDLLVANKTIGISNCEYKSVLPVWLILTNFFLDDLCQDPEVNNVTQGTSDIAETSEALVSSVNQPISVIAANTEENDDSSHLFDDSNNANSTFFDNINSQTSDQVIASSPGFQEKTAAESTEDSFKAIFDENADNETNFLDGSTDMAADKFFENLEASSTKPAKNINEAALSKIFEDDSEEEFPKILPNKSKDLSQSLAFLNDDNDLLPDDYLEPVKPTHKPSQFLNSSYNTHESQRSVSYTYSPQNPSQYSTDISPLKPTSHYAPQSQTGPPTFSYVPQPQNGRPASPYTPKAQPGPPNSPYTSKTPLNLSTSSTAYAPKPQFGPSTSSYAPQPSIAPFRKTHVSRNSMPINAFDLPTELVSETARIYHNHHPTHFQPQPLNTYGSFNQNGQNPAYSGMVPSTSTKPYLSDLPKISTQINNSNNNQLPFHTSGGIPVNTHRAHFRNYSGSLPVNSLNSNMYQPHSNSPAVGSPLSSNIPINSGYIHNNRNDQTLPHNQYDPGSTSPALSRYDPRHNITKPPVISASQQPTPGANLSSPVTSHPRNSAFGDMPADIGQKQAELYRSPEVQQAIQNARHYRSLSGSNWNVSPSPVAIPPGANSPNINVNKRHSMPSNFSDSPGLNSYPGRPASAAPIPVDTESLMRRQFPIFSWGMGGKAVYLIPPQISFGGSARPPEVKVVHASSIIKTDSDIKKFPFPLVTGKGVQKNKKKELEKWIANHIEIMDKSLGFQRNDDSSRFSNRIILWKIMLSLLQGESNTQKPGKPLKDAIRMVLDPHVAAFEEHKYDATFAPAVDGYRKLQRHGSNAGISMGRNLKSDDINKIVDLLKVGLKENALKYSLDNHLWSHAFIIASSMNPAEWVSSVAEFVREEIREFPSQSSRDLAFIYRVFSGAGADAVSEILPGQFATAINEPQVGPQLQASLASWKSTISMMFSNFSLANNEAAKMYSSLLLRAGNVEASHLCNVLLNIGVFGSGGVDTLSFELFGSDPEFGAGFGSDVDSILLSLVLEFYKISTEPVLPTIPYYPHLVLYKLQLTSYLIDIGSVNEAQNLFDSVSSIIKAAGKNLSYSQPLYKFMDFVSQRLSLTYQDETSSSWLSSKLGRPKLDKMLGQLDKSFSKFVTGEDTIEDTNAGDNGIFKKLAETPTVSRVQSVADFSGVNPLSTQQINSFDNNYGSIKAEGYAKSSINLQSYASHSRNSSLVNLQTVGPVLSPPPIIRHQVDQRAPSPLANHRTRMALTSTSSVSLASEYATNGYNLSRPQSASANRSRRSSFKDGHEKPEQQQKQQQQIYGTNLTALPTTLAPGFTHSPQKFAEERTHRRSSSNVSVTSNITGSPRKPQYLPVNPYDFSENQVVASGPSVNSNRYAPHTSSHSSINGSVPPSPQNGRKTPNSTIPKQNSYSPQNNISLPSSNLPYSDSYQACRNTTTTNSLLANFQNAPRPGSAQPHEIFRPGSSQRREISRPGSAQPREISRPGSAQPLELPRSAYVQKQTISSPGSTDFTQSDERIAPRSRRNSGVSTSSIPVSPSSQKLKTPVSPMNTVKRQVTAPPTNPYAFLSSSSYSPPVNSPTKPNPYAPYDNADSPSVKKYAPSNSTNSVEKYAPASGTSFSASNVVEDYTDVSFGSIYGYTPANHGPNEPPIPEEPETMNRSPINNIDEQNDNEDEQLEGEEIYEEYEAPQYGNTINDDDFDEGALDDLPEAPNKIFTPMSAPTFAPQVTESDNDALKGSTIFHDSNKMLDKEDEDFGLSNSTIKPKNTDETQEKTETNSKRNSWFSFLRRSSSSEKATQINFGEEMSLVYDPVLKRYVNKNAPKESLKPEPKVAPPPPGPSITLSQSALPLSISATTPPASGPPRSISVQPNGSSPMTADSPVKPSLTPGPSLTGDLDDLISSASTHNSHTRKPGKRNARSRYVDIMHQ